MHELFPITTGLVVGFALAAIRPSLRWWIAAPVVILLGVTATVVSGEYKVSWEFLLVDIPLVALSAAVGFLVTRPLSRRIHAALRPVD